MKRFVEGTDRGQSTLFTERYNDLLRIYQAAKRDGID